MNQGISELGTSQASGAPSIDNRSISPRASYTPREKRGALNRHTVIQRDISIRDLIGMGTVGGLVGGTLAGVVKSGADFSWMKVAATSAIGATVFVLGTVASARQNTPLENAEAELIQTEKDRLYLLRRYTNNPAHEFGANEIYTIKRLSERYQMPWRTFKLLWDVLYEPGSQVDYDNFLHEIFSKFTDQQVNYQRIHEIHEQMACTNSIKEVMQLETFQELTRRHSLGTRNELAELMFTYTRLTLSDKNRPGGETPQSLYQRFCREIYAHLKYRIYSARDRALNDIDILRSMANEQR